MDVFKKLTQEKAESERPARSEPRTPGGDRDTGEILNTAKVHDIVGEQRDRQAWATRGGMRGQRMPTLVAIGQVTQMRQRKLTEFYQKNTRRCQQDEKEHASDEEEKEGNTKGEKRRGAR